MVRILVASLFMAPLLSFSAAGFDRSAVRDSIGVERKNGKLFVLHKVDPKETLYALSRRYNVTVEQIVEANPSVESTISIGQVVLIPRLTSPISTTASNTKSAPVSTPVSSSAPSASARTFTVNEKGDKLHIVEPKQTLYAISRIHRVSVEDLKRWNNLTSDQVKIGSSLIVGKGAAVASKKPIYVPEPDDSIVPEKATEAPIAPVATTPTPTPTPASTTAAAAPEKREVEEDEETGLKRVVESGMGEIIDPKSDTNKYLALHKSAPVGTIMQVKNVMNGQVVYVRIIGKLPDTGSNEKVIVRISKKASQKLGVVDSKFRVELSYMPS